VRPAGRAGARQTDVVRAQGISPALLGRWQRQALEAAVTSSAEREEIKRLRAELKHVEMARDSLKKVVTIFSQPLPS
jgi:transposase